MSSANLYALLDRKLHKSPSKSIVPVLLPILLIIVLYFAVSIILMDATATSMQQRQQEVLGKAASLSIFNFVAICIRLITLFVHTAIVVVICLLLSRKFYANTAKRRTGLAIALYGEVCYAIGWLLTAPLILYSKNLDASYSLANLIPGAGPGSLQFTLLSRLTIFFVLEVIWIAGGIAFFSDAPRSKAYLYSIGTMVGSLVLMFLVFH